MMVGVFVGQNCIIFCCTARHTASRILNIMMCSSYCAVDINHDVCAVAWGCHCMEGTCHCCSIIDDRTFSINNLHWKTPTPNHSGWGRSCSGSWAPNKLHVEPPASSITSAPLQSSLLSVYFLKKKGRLSMHISLCDSRGSPPESYCILL